MANPVNWFHISVKDVAHVARFYGEAFDWKVTPGPGDMAFAETGKGGIPGGIAGIMDGSDKSTIHIYVGTDNIEAQLARIEKAGGKAVQQRTPLPPGMGFIAGFVDPAGNFVGLWENAPKAKATPKRRAPAKAKVAKKAAKKPAAKKAAKAAKKPAAKKAAKKR